MKEIEAIILAGGNGSRMKEFTSEQQKCLLPVEGRPALGHIMQSLVDAFGSVDLKIGVAYKSEQVKEYVDRNKPNKITVTYIPHAPGTEGWGIYRNMRSHIKGTFVAMPGDIIALPEGYEKAVRAFKDTQSEAAMTLSPQLDVVDTHGIGRIENGTMVELKWPPPSIVQSGYLRDMTIWASDSRFFNIIEHYPSPKKSIGVVFMKALQDGRKIAGNSYELPWIHLGYPEDLRKKWKT